MCHKINLLRSIFRLLEMFFRLQEPERKEAASGSLSRSYIQFWGIPEDRYRFPAETSIKHYHIF